MIEKYITPIDKNNQFMYKTYSLVSGRNRYHDYDIKLLNWQLENNVVLFTESNIANIRGDENLICYRLSTIASTYVDESIEFAYGYVKKEEPYSDLDKHPQFSVVYDYDGEDYDITYYNSLGKAHSTKYLTIYADKDCTKIGWNIKKEVLFDLAFVLEEVQYYNSIYDYYTNKDDYTDKINNVLCISKELGSLCTYKKNQAENIYEDTFNLLCYNLTDIIKAIHYLSKICGLDVLALKISEMIKKEEIDEGKENFISNPITYQSFTHDNSIQIRNNLISKYNIEEDNFIGSFPIYGNEQDLINQIYDLEIDKSKILNNFSNEVIDSKNKDNKIIHMKDISPKMIPGMLSHYTAFYKKIRINDKFLIPTLDESMEHYLTYFYENDGYYQIKEENLFRPEIFKDLLFTYNQLYTMLYFSYKAFLAEIQLYIVLNKNKYIATVEYNSVIDFNGFDFIVTSFTNNNQYGIQSYLSSNMGEFYHQEKITNRHNKNNSILMIEAPIHKEKENMILTKTGDSIYLYTSIEINQIILKILKLEITNILSNLDNPHYSELMQVYEKIIYAEVDEYLKLK